MYVLYTACNRYVNEFLFQELVLCENISQALVFTDLSQAHKFKEMLFERCSLNCSINTFIA